MNQNQNRSQVAPKDNSVTSGMVHLPLGNEISKSQKVPAQAQAPIAIKQENNQAENIGIDQSSAREITQQRNNVAYTNFNQMSEQRQQQIMQLNQIQ